MKGGRTALELLSTGTLNIVLRGATLASKFVLVLLIARYLTPADFGVFGLVNTTVALSLFLLGFDFYVFSSREMLARPERDWAAMIRDQLVFHGLVYLVGLPLLLGAFLLDLVPWRVLPWFYALVVLEHVSQEAYRLLITLSRPIAANFTLFLRSGAWIYAVGAFMWAAENARRLDWVWSGWLVGVAASIVASWWFVRHLAWNEARRTAIDWGWIRIGLRRGASFLVASFAMKAIESIDRYFLKAYQDEAAVGVYTLYYGLANVIYVFVFAGVVSTFHPVLLRTRDLPEYSGHLRRFSWWLVLSTLAVAVAVALGFDLVLMLVDKAEYAAHTAAFYVLVGASCLLAASTVPHYALYVRRRDRPLVISSVAALATAVLAHVTLVPNWGILGSALATAVGMGVLLTAKSAFAMLDRSS